MSQDGAGFRDPKVLIPFVVITFIWGSTWLVIRDQLGVVPAIWSVTYRFTIACAAMFAYARFSGASLRIGADGHRLALMFGLPQFFLNFNFVYQAEHHVTSGLVAVVFALLMVPNTTLGWLFLKHRITGGFLAGSAIAVAGIALLFVQEMRTSTAAPSEIWLGIGLTVGGVLSASVSNVLQASDRLRMRPMASMIAWGMFYGVIANAIVALITAGSPVIDDRPEYFAGVLYLGLFASALAFPLYFGIIRAVGPGKAAYNSLIVPIIAMALSTLFEGYVWSPLALAGGALALTGLFIALRERAPAK